VSKDTGSKSGKKDNSASTVVDDRQFYYRINPDGNIQYTQASAGRVSLTELPP
jgi:hypothetical protein